MKAFEEHRDVSFDEESVNALTQQLLEISGQENEQTVGGALSKSSRSLSDLFRTLKSLQKSPIQQSQQIQQSKRLSMPGLKVTAAEFRPQSTRRVQASNPVPIVISETEAFVHVLQHEFPQYSAAALEDIFLHCGKSLPATIDMMYSLEHELSGQLQTLQISSENQQRPSDSDGGRPTTGKSSVFSLSQEEFPSLGGQTGKSKETRAKTALPFGANYATTAANAPTVAPASRSKFESTIRLDINGRSMGAGKPAAGSKPVWESPTGIVPKFSTGESVAAEYAEARAVARDHARLRNVCFQQATQAYMAGNKALAKELGAKGRWHNEQMKAAHAKAAMDTFAKRNNLYLHQQHTGAPTASASIPTIDLHGLHVSEALLHLERTLIKLQSMHTVHQCRVVVGVGQHSKVPSRLPLAVRDTLSSWGLKYSEPYQGVLEVKLH